MRCQQNPDTFIYFIQSVSPIESMYTGSGHPEDKTGETMGGFTECETWIKTIIGASPIPQFIIDGDHRVLFWNRALEKYSGMKAGDILRTKDHWRAFYSYERPCLADLLIDGLEDRIPEYYPGKYKKSTFPEDAYEATDFFPLLGETGTWLNFTAALIRDEKGVIIGAVETLDDVTGRKQAEEELIKSEKKYRSLFELANDAIFLHTLTTDHKPGRILEANQVALRMLGYEKDELLKMGPPDIVPPEFHNQLKDIVRQSKTKDTFIFETIFLRKDGTKVPVETSTHLVDYDGKKIWISNIRDLTERKKAEEALNYSEKKYRNIVENISDVILTIDPKGIITYINPVIWDLYGYTPDEITGKMFLKFIHPEDLPKATEGFQQRLKGKFVENTLRVLSKDGSERYVRTIPTPIIHDGEVKGLNYIMTDLTERIRAEEALRMSEKKYRNLVENISDVIFTLNPEGVITYMSPVIERIYGYKPDEATGQRFDRFIHPDDLPMVEELFSHYLKGEQVSKDVYVRAVAGDGSTRYVRANTTVITDEDDIREFNFVITDLTERKKAEEALTTINNKLNMLSSVTRHDILNAINAVRGYLEMSEDFVEDPTLREYIEKEEEAVDAIQHQIEFTRYYQDIGMKEPGWQNVSEIIKSAAESLDTGGIKIDCFPDGLEIFCDPLIEKVFYNLIDNSIRHGEHVTEISLSYMTEGENLVITYRDNGAGISDEDRKTLFRKGFGKNTGLGLFLSREILAITSIEISETGKEGEGVNFRITVPKDSYRFKE